MGGTLFGELLEAAAALAEDARSKRAGRQAPPEGVWRSEAGRLDERRDRRLLALSVASAGEVEDQGGDRGKGSAQALHGSPGAARASAHPERRGSQEAVAVQSVLGCRVPGRGEGVVPAALCFVVGAAADRGRGAELLAQRRSHHHGDWTSDLQG